MLLINFVQRKRKKIKRIKCELRICANLKHANILPVYGYTYGFGPFLAIVSPWAENGNLSDYLELEGAALTLVKRFRILRDIIAGLQYLHANSVIHGDFTGPNVLVHGDGTACRSFLDVFRGHKRLSGLLDVHAEREHAMDGS
jgi:serine/threonine protein kinase